MVDIIAPRRNELFTKDGDPTLRFSEFLEMMTGSSNSNTSTTDLFSSLNISTSALSNLANRIDDLDLLASVDPLTSALSELSSQIDCLDSQVSINQSNSGLSKKIDDLSIILDMPQGASAISSLLKKIVDLQTILDVSPLGSMSEFKKKFEIVEVVAAATTFVTTGDQVVICNNTAAANVTLNTNPKDGEELHVKRNNSAAVTLIGTVDGVVDPGIIGNYDSPHLIYTIAAGQWGFM